MQNPEYEEKLEWPRDYWPTSMAPASDKEWNASVAGWKAYRTGRPSESADMQTVRQYNEVDCTALHELVRWLRRPTTASAVAGPRY